MPEWFLWFYFIGAIITGGFVLGVNVRRQGFMDLPTLLSVFIFGLIWPTTLVGMLFYFVFDYFEVK